MVKGSIQEEDIIIINIYALTIGAPRYLQQILTDIKGEIDGNTIIVGDFNTPLTSMDRSFRHKLNKATEIQKETIEKLDLINIFRTLHPKRSEYTLFSSHMQHSQGSIKYWGTNVSSTNLRCRNYFKHDL